MERVGGRKEIPVDVRVICATHKDLHELIRNGEFREDLYYRISELTVTIPSLRQREGVKRQSIKQQVARRRNETVEVKDVPSGQGV